jgi:hypothetical protein
MSAAVNNLSDAKEFTRAYEGLLRHYRIGGQKIQARQAHETATLNNGITGSRKRPIKH